MTRRPRSRKPPNNRDPTAPAALPDCRREIDRIDEEIIALLDARARVARRVGELKAARGDDYFDAGRHMQLLGGIAQRGDGDFPREGLRNVYGEILSACLNLQSPQTIAYHGPEGGFAHLAALRAFGRSPRFLARPTIGGVFEAVQKLEAHFGVVPVETTTEGIMHATLDEFTRTDLSICAEVQLPIRHHLLGRGPMRGVRRVVAEERALAQCIGRLRAQLPQARLTPAAGAIEAFRAARRSPAAAAIGSKQAAETHGLEVLAEGIEDVKGALVRFIAIGHRSPDPSEFDRTSVMLALKDEPGALHHLLKPFADRKINLRRIDSRPSGRPWEYVFFLDIEGHMSRPEVSRVLKGLRRHCTSLRVLGSYPVDRARLVRGA